MSDMTGERLMRAEDMWRSTYKEMNAHLWLTPEELETEISHLMEPWLAEVPCCQHCGADEEWVKRFNSGNPTYVATPTCTCEEEFTEARAEKMIERLRREETRHHLERIAQEAKALDAR